MRSQTEFLNVFFKNLFQGEPINPINQKTEVNLKKIEIFEQ